ncbi:PTS sugar transporter subunit IIA [Treponema brennaborense]|uniref:PTS IIA-like nitrogen-regulatory protein PtsN n=1 Tax=Treponema brennaborense (strain DSM 12168 / CIP 105900 / DD5/3) TaxID=906968 RepID=F4LLM4_TREBD|nr:PTS sugar transporter subunit IIA [Treponema brennaborense]AEE17668.1 putative PTS IIA-like nitrogen-regulatory protein PtsN [Treponema brennaborense DSM 12168]
MSETTINVCDLIEKGGVFYGVPGAAAADVYAFVCAHADFPAEISADVFCRELISRDALMSTAVGNGIALPHPTHPLLKDASLQRIFLCFPERPLDMNAPDGRPVSSLFILLTGGSRCHLDILSQLANLFQKTSVRHLLERQADKNTLLAEMRKIVSEL